MVKDRPRQLRYLTKDVPRRSLAMLKAVEVLGVYMAKLSFMPPQASPPAKRSCPAVALVGYAWPCHPSSSVSCRRKRLRLQSGGWHGQGPPSATSLFDQGRSRRSLAMLNAAEPVDADRCRTRRWRSGLGSAAGWHGQGSPSATLLLDQGRSRRSLAMSKTVKVLGVYMAKLGFMPPPASRPTARSCPAVALVGYAWPCHPPRSSSSAGETPAATDGARHPPFHSPRRTL